VICTSRIDEYFHREAVLKIIWVPSVNLSSGQSNYNLTTVATDGKILVWREEDKLKFPVKGYLLARKKKGELATVGGTSLAISIEDKSCFIVGTESGSMFKCNLVPV
jgi:hypothetical protein